jgi:hypothetical protein
VSLRRLLLAALVAVVLVPVGHSQRVTTAPSIYVNVHVTLTGSRVVVSPNSAPRGSNARFIVRNITHKPLTFTMGTARRGAGLQSGFSRTFKPGTQSILLLYLDYRGVISYFGGQSLAKATPAMKGSFSIGLQCSLCVQDN